MVYEHEQDAPSQGARKTWGRLLRLTLLLTQHQPLKVFCRHFAHRYSVKDRALLSLAWGEWTGEDREVVTDH